MINITDIDDYRIRHYRNLRFTPSDHTAENIFISEGEKVTLRLLQSNLNIVSVFALPEYYDKHHDLIQAKIDESHCYVADKDLMNQIVGFRLHTGIMAIAAQPEPVALDMLDSPIVILNNIINSENVGSIIRNAVAFGLNSIILDKATSHPFMRRSVRVSMGTVLDIKYHISENISETIHKLKTLEYKIISAELTDNSSSLYTYKFPPKYAIIFGSEGHGINPQLLSLSDDVLEIPINPKVPSLNVAASSALFFSQIAQSPKIF